MTDIAAKDRRAFLLRKAHSLSGVVPVGVFLIEHLWTNAAALGGRASFDRSVVDIQRIPLLPVIEVAFIFVPLAFHALYGVKLSFEARPNPLTYVHGRNWLYTLQRVTGLVTLVFIAVHLWEFRVQKWLYGMSSGSFFDTLSEHLSITFGAVPVVALAYVVAIACAVFHFANGLSGFAMSWGIASSRRALRVSTGLGAALGVFLFVLGLSTVVFFATGTRLLPIGSALGDPRRGQTTLEAPCPGPK